jgi:hypothetical protein
MVDYQAPSSRRRRIRRRYAADKNSGAGRSILWIVIVLALVSVLTLIITVRQGQFKSKVGGFFKEITGVGHKHRSDDPRNRM